LARQLAEAAVDHGAFEKALAVCELTKCRATCCHDGVILSQEEADVLKELGAEEGIEIRKGGKIGTKTVLARNEELGETYPEHFAKTRCVFLDEEHRCQWQLRALSEGKHPWYYKPFSCWLHPVLIDLREGRPLITMRSREDDEAAFASHTPCGQAIKGAAPARESLAMELQMLGEISGRDFYAELNAPKVTTLAHAFEGQR